MLDCKEGRLLRQVKREDSIDKNFKYKDERGNTYGIERNLYTASCP